MAEYSITNSAPRYTVQSTYQTYTKEMGANTFRWTNATVGQQLVRFDFSDIPEGATINAAEMVFQSNDDYSGYGYQTIMSGNTGWKTANNANIKEWLAEHDRVLIVRSTFQGKDGKITSGTTPPKATRTVTKFSIKVTYTTAAGTSYVKYGSTVSTGETALWNQLHNFSAGTIWCNADEWSIHDRVVYYVPDSSWSTVYTLANTALNANHVYLFTVKVRATANTTLYLSANGNNQAINVTTEWKRYSLLVPHPTEQWGEFYVVDMKGSGYVPVSITDWCVIDLTMMYGAGHEPSTLSDERIPLINAYADRNPQYNAGQLIPVLEYVWQKCEPYYIVDGEAQKCDVYYGDGDEWVKISTDE